MNQLRRLAHRINGAYSAKSLLVLYEVSCKESSIGGGGCYQLAHESLIYLRMMKTPHNEHHQIKAITWLRAAVLGADDGIISTASLILGVAAAQASHASILLAGVSGLVAGAMSMAAGEYVSVSAQTDTEQASLKQEQAELIADPGSELRELTAIYVCRGLEPQLALQVAQQMMAHDALAAHARDELGMSKITTPHPLQAALASAASFIAGSMFPLAVAVLAPTSRLMILVASAALVALALLGALAAQTGGAKMLPGVMRTTLWGALAMMVTAAAGSVFGS
jgi:VIT1/CCC1 family predicted Fe2+/Mn2+ transporter